MGHEPQGWQVFSAPSALLHANGCRLLFLAMGCGAGSGLTAINNLGQVRGGPLADLASTFFLGAPPLMTLEPLLPLIASYWRL